MSAAYVHLSFAEADQEVGSHLRAVVTLDDIARYRRWGPLVACFFP